MQVVRHAALLARAARVLRPGGSVALWAGGPKHVHPAVPNAEAIEAEMDVIEHTVLRPYMEPGNLLARDLYVDLEAAVAQGRRRRAGRACGGGL